MKSNFNIAKDRLSIQDVHLLLSNKASIKLSTLSISRIKKSREYIYNEVVKNNRPIYGVNTGFGSLCDKSISLEEIDKLQNNLIISHACGVGEEVPDDIVKIMLLLKIRSLALGFSGVRLDLIQALILYYNHNLFSIVFQQGSLGASGDLAPLAHLSLPLLGKGNVSLSGKKMSTKLAFKKLGLKPISLSFKEGLALLNGTQFMTAYGIWSILESKKIFYLSNLIAAISLEAFICNKSSFDPLISKIRPHIGQTRTASIILKLLKGSSQFFKNNDYVQDPYSFRCIPQVHGAYLDVLEHVESIFNIEINSVTDNPSVFYNQKKVISGGNFHGQSLALSLDYLSMALSEIGNISERRIFKLISGERKLPMYLINNPGLNSGFMITQYTAASIVSQNKQYATPASVDSIVSSNGQEDHVSMGANSATKLYKIVNNVQTILAIELLNAVQALQMRNIKTSSLLQKIIKSYRKDVPFIESDQQMNILISKSKLFLSKLDIKDLIKFS